MATLALEVASPRQEAGGWLGDQGRRVRSEGEGTAEDGEVGAGAGHGQASVTGAKPATLPPLLHTEPRVPAQRGSSPAGAPSAVVTG